MGQGYFMTVHFEFSWKFHPNRETQLDSLKPSQLHYYGWDRDISVKFGGKQRKLDGPELVWCLKTPNSLKNQLLFQHLSRETLWQSDQNWNNFVTIWMSNMVYTQKDRAQKGCS